MGEQNYETTELLDQAGISAKIDRIACEILERHADQSLAFVGIFKRGVTFADRVRAAVTGKGRDVVSGTLDINLYRDDLDNLGTSPAIQSSNIPFPVDGAHVILFDDVLFTGRTIRAAIDALMDFGRPARIQLATLIDRGNRELPIQADFTGHRIESTRDEYIRVRFQENDGEEGIYLLREKTTS